MEGVPDIPERELSLDVLGNLDMCRLESLGGQCLGSIGNLPSLGSRLGGHGGQRLESLGNLESLGKLGLETFGQRLESIGHGDLSSNSLEGISRQLLGSLPENDPAIKDMLNAAIASQPQGSSPTQGAACTHESSRKNACFKRELNLGFDAPWSPKLCRPVHWSHALLTVA